MSSSEIYDSYRSEMLASSIMLMSISEKSVTNVGYGSSSGGGSFGGLRGSAMSRTKSYKADLNSLTNHHHMSTAQSNTASSNRQNEGEGWGYFVDSFPRR
mmetsp:Transcript_25457/g.36237  ORF Transcript_25457/g.36237 Transcript_25457/m.36237 type:complete len:100 (-) Transcript_25457:154-453(-)